MHMSAMSTPSGNVRAVDYYRSAFGGFAPQKDEDAAIKFILHCLLVAGRFEAMPDLIQESGGIGALEGDPGWRLEKRDTSNEAKPAYGAWPVGAKFCAYVDPDAYELAHPRFFMDRQKFIGYLHAALRAYADANPAAVDMPHFASLVRAR